MKIRIQMVIDDQDQSTIKEVACFEREELSAETLGLTLKKAKTIVSGVQEALVPHQITEFIAQQ